jgi:hypothetical protein
MPSSRTRTGGASTPSPGAPRVSAPWVRGRAGKLACAGRTAPARGEIPAVHSRRLHAVLTQLTEEAAIRLQAHVASGEEVPFELDSRSGRRGSAPLYCYRPLTAAYIAERFPLLRALTMHKLAIAQLDAFDGLERYLIARGVDSRSRGACGRADMALLAFLQEVFEEQTEFQVHDERLQRALARLDGSTLAKPADVTILATLHGLAICSKELQLTRGLTLVQPGALEGVPEQALRLSDDHLLVVYASEDADTRAGMEHGPAVIADLLRSLRLYGDGRIALGPLAWRRVADGPWSALPLGGKGHPHGMLLVTADQEDELRAFCNLVSRRAPQEGPLAWALGRFELGCERASEYEALSDHLLALRALLGGPRETEPEGSSSNLLAVRLAALCATSEHRATLTERTLAAIALERAVVAGAAVEHAGGLELVRSLSENLRALLRDVICGYLPDDLVGLADEILLAGGEPREPVIGEHPGELPGEEAGKVASDPGEPSQVLDLAL